ncbi:MULTISPECIES: hypothetical protein [unclassified Kribbella]|uniref:hypothetical protein n=1 Tax=unclassified Kribbella TaxID=2644121 RepID=UPI0033EA96DA
MTAMTFLPAAEIDPNSVRPGWVALLIVLALGAATALLVRNMGKQLKKIDFDRDFARDQAPSDGPVSTDSSAAPAGDAEPTEPTAATKPSTDSDSNAHSKP